jgi:hypothetical protein
MIAGMPPTAPSLADLSNTGTLVVLAAGQLVTWWLIVRDDRRRAAERAADRASAEARESAAMKDLASANGRIAGALEKLETWARGHEVSDERRWAAYEEVHKAHMETNQRLTNITEDLARRITNVALEKAPAPFSEVPPNRRARS